MTSGILAILYLDTDAVLDIDPTAFMTLVQVSTSPNSADLEFQDFQPYIVQAWASFQVDKASKEAHPQKCIWFDNVAVPAKQAAKPNPKAATVSDEMELISPEVQQSQQGVFLTMTQPSAPNSSILRKDTGKAADNVELKQSAASGSSNVPPQAPNAHQSSPYSPNSQYRYWFPLEDEAAPKQVLDQVLETNVLVPVKDFFLVFPEFQKWFHNLTTIKRVTMGLANIVQVNEVSGCDPEQISREYGNYILRNEDGLIVTHHNLPLHCLYAKAGASELTINCILDSGSEIITIPKQVWEKPGLPICSDHTMTMSSANTSTNVTSGILENLSLNFRSGEVCLQVQVLVRANFELLLRRLFHCLMSATTDNFLVEDRT